MRSVDFKLRVFLCFSGTLRKRIAEALSYHLRKYGVDVWYDFHELYLGDFGDMKNLAGIDGSQYAVLIISEDFFQRSGTILELERMKALWEKQELTLLPLLYDISSDAIPDSFEWLNDLIYARIEHDCHLESIALQVVARLYRDAADQCRCPSLGMLARNQNAPGCRFISQAIEFYLSIDPSNLTARLTTLILMAKFIDPLSLGAKPINDCMSRLTAYTQLNLKTDFKELSIAESCVIILLNRETN